MMKRFPPKLLWLLRNQIPIRSLISRSLQIPTKYSERQFRFLCPLCSEFNTATNLKTNLARCFRCNKNFNPIDMVMTVKKYTFIDSVLFLKPILLENLPQLKKN